MLAIAGDNPNDFFTIWPTNNFAYPKYVFKNFKDNLVKFDFDTNCQILITGSKNEDKKIKIYKLSDFE